MRTLVATAVPLTLLVLMTALRIVDLATSRAEILRAGEARAANLAQITSTYLGEAFASVDTALRQLVVHSKRIGGPSAPATEWLPILAAARAGLPIGALSVTDRDGIIRHSTQPLLVGQSRRDEATVRALMNADSDTLIAGAPYRTLNAPPGAQRFIVPIGRKLVDAGGQTIGTVVASFVPEAARPFLRSLDVGRGGFVWVLHPEGVVLYEEPSQEDHTGRQVRDHPVFVTARQHESGLVRDASGPDAAAKRIAYRTRLDPPLITAIALDEAELLAPWRQDAWRSGILFGLLSVMLIAVALVLAREMAARSAALAREEAARREAEAASAVKDQFLMTLSHELRTPLTAICGWANMLAANVVDEGGRARAVKAIERNARVQQRLIDDLLDISGIMAGKIPLNVQTVPMAAIAQQALETVRPAAEAKGVRIRGEIPTDAGNVSGDAERLQQIIWNLLSNAIKFTPAGGEVLLKVRRTRDAHLRVDVSDTGIGISPEFLPRVFDRFAQEDATTTRAHGGLGLGLSIVRSLVELHGGTVTVHSEGTNRGTRFEVVLPAAPATAATDHMEPENVATT